MDEDAERTLALGLLHDATSWRGWAEVIDAWAPVLLTHATIDWLAAYAQSVLDDPGRSRLSSDLRQAADILSRCIAEGPDSALGPLLDQPLGGDPSVAGLLAAAGPGLLRHSDLQTLNESIQFLDAALVHPAMNLAPIGVRRQAEYGAAVLRQRVAEWTHSEEVLAEVNVLVDSGLCASLPQSALRPQYLHLKATNLLIQDDWGQCDSHYVEAVEILEAVSDAQPEGSLPRAAAADALGAAQYRHYLQKGDVADLTAAIANFRQALYAEGDFRTSAAANLASALLRLHRHNGNEENLAEAAAVAESAVSATPEAAPQRASRLTLLADVLRQRYLRDASRRADLDRAIELLDEAWQVAGEANREGRRRAAGSLSQTLLAAWERHGNPEDALRAIDLAREAINLTTALDDWYAEDASALGSALLAANQVTGEPTLPEAIYWLRACADRTSDVDIRKPGRLTNLSYALQALYRAEGTLVAIDEALAVSDAAVQLARDDDSDLATYLFAQGLAHSQRYDAYGERRDLAGSLVSLDRALDSLPDTAPEVPLLYASLGGALLDRHALGEYAEDLDTAIEYLEAGLARVPGEFGDRQRIIIRLVAGLLDRYDRDGRDSDADRAVELARRAVGTHQGDLSLVASTQIALGSSLAARAVAHELPTDRIEAYAVLRNCCANIMDIFPTAALAASTRWAAIALAARDDLEAAAAYRQVLMAERRVYQSQLTRQDQRIRLRHTRAVFTDAAFAFASVGDLRGAVLAVENGRARLVTERLGQSRADLEAVIRAGRPDLSQTLVDAIKRVNMLEATFADPSLTSRPSPPRRSLIDVADLQAARADVDRILTEIRALPRLAEFLIDTSWEHVAAVSGSSPLLYLLAGTDGGLALIVDDGIIRQLPPTDLPTLTQTAVLDRVATLLQAREDDFPGWLDLLDETLRWSWDAVVGPVLDTVSEAGIVNAIPCGLLALLPLHAAWTTNTDGTRCYASDLFVWRYQPNARCMLQTDSHTGWEQTAVDILDRRQTVLVVHSPSRSDLPSPLSAGQDHATLAQQMNVVELSGTDATADRVIAALPYASIVHFACHAEADLSDAENSAFLLAEQDRLTVSRLLRAETGHQRLAILAACETGVPEGLIPDETVTLGTALLVNGASGVLASLWKVSDRATQLLMGKFYALWLAEGDHQNEDPARALRDAQLWLRTLSERDISFAHPSLWAGFTFIGL